MFSYCKAGARRASLYSSTNAREWVESPWNKMVPAPWKDLIKMTCFYLKKAISLNLPWLQPTAGSVQASLNLMLLLDEVVESVWHPELLNSRPHGWTVEKARFPYHSSE